MELGIKIEIEHKGKIPIVLLEGRMDAASTPMIEKHLAPIIEKHSSFLIDCSKIYYLSSAGLRLFLSITKKLHQNKEKVCLFDLNEEVLEIIKIAGFETLLHIFKSKESALKSLS